MQPLTDRTMRIVERLFRREDHDAAREVLSEECGTNLPFCERHDPVGLERVRFAVLKLSEGNLGELRTFVGHAKVDWRDVLVWAGFGNSLTEHERWADAILGGAD